MQLSNAQELARQVKQAIRSVGETLRRSVGLAPNRFLAKVASNMQKPDGLVTITQSQLPEVLFSMKPRDLPGLAIAWSSACSVRELRPWSNYGSLISTG